jgi:hypothetical protein
MLYHGIAARVAGPGDDLSRVRSVFDWMVRQVQLVPPGSLGSQGMQQAYARPFDVLLRGMATEAEGVWSERGWLFLSLCRQLGLDAGLITYTPPGLKEPIVWCCVVLIEGKPYLFDTRIGLPIPDAKGTGVATLEEAMTDERILARMDLPAQSPYGTTREALVASPSKIGVLIDSSPRYFSPRMKLLQASLVGKNLTVLYRDPAEQRDKFAEALGPRFGKLGLWELPMMVEALLFTSQAFVTSTQNSLFMFKSEFPLLMARMKQLRGETDAAIADYVDMRFRENATLADKKTLMPPELQQAVDAYASYFLGTCQLDRNDSELARSHFERALALLPEPGRGRPNYNMFRWGAQANLARLMEAKGELGAAVAYYSRPNPTMQQHGNLLRARDLTFADPLAPPPAPLPAAPAPPAQPGAPPVAAGPGGALPVR